MSDHLVRSAYYTPGRNTAVIQDSRAIQQAVFVEEQGIEPADVFNGEYYATHYVLYARVGDRLVPVACARVMHDRPSSPIKIGRVATLAEHRRNKYARYLLEHIIEEQGERYSPPYFYLNSQVDAMGLYESLNFETRGESFNEAGIRHIRMVLPWRTVAA